MAGVLDLLQAYLTQARPVAADEGSGLPDMSALQQLQQQMGGAPPPQTPALPPDLPDVVRQAILGQPSYGEGERWPRRSNPALEQENSVDNMMGGVPQREEYLRQQLAQAQENQWRQRMGLPVIGAATQFASPLNQLMPRWGSQATGL